MSDPQLRIQDITVMLCSLRGLDLMRQPLFFVEKGRSFAKSALHRHLRKVIQYEKRYLFHC